MTAGTWRPWPSTSRSAYIAWPASRPIDPRPAALWENAAGRHICLAAWAWIRRPDAAVPLCLLRARGSATRTVYGLPPPHAVDGGIRPAGAIAGCAVGDVNLRRSTDIQNNHSTERRLATRVDGVSQGEGGDILSMLDDPHSVSDVAIGYQTRTVHEWWSKSWSTRMNNA